MIGDVRGNLQSRASSSSRPPKRAQVSVACNQCRKGKIRCSATRPRCKNCASKDLECIYDTTGVEETRRQASLRRQSELETQNTSYANLFGLLQSLAPQRAEAGLQLIRDGLDAQSVLTRLRDDEATLPPPAGPSNSREAEEPSLLVDGHAQLHDLDMSDRTHSNMGRKRRAAPNVSGQRKDSGRNPSLLRQRITLNRICPFDSMFNRSEPQWSISLAEDLDQCLKGARSALPFLTDQEQALIPSASRLVTVVLDDDLLFRVAGLITCATFPGSDGQQVSQRPNLVWCRDSVLSGLQSRVKAMEKPSQVLVGVMALLAGWEWMYGSPGAFRVHMNALERLLGLIKQDKPLPFAVRPSNDQALLPLAPLAPGFEFLKAQRLLPSELLTLIQHVSSIQVSDHSFFDKFKRLTLVATGIKPVGTQAVEAHQHGHLASRVANYCRVATIMCLTISLASTTDGFWNSMLIEGMRPTYEDIVGPSLEELLATVYDEVLLWCLTVYYLTLGDLCPEHQQAFGSLLGRFDISIDPASRATILGLLKRYIYHDAMGPRLHWMIERKAKQAQVGNVEASIEGEDS